MNLRYLAILAATAIIVLSAAVSRAGDGSLDDCSSKGCDSVIDGKADCGCDAGLLQGLLVPSEACFDDFISPMTNPVFFEDPRTLTEARVIFMNHKIPLLPGVTTSTDAIQLYAMQVRAAINDRLSIIATKDGYVVSESPLVDDGWADVAAGLKLNLYRDTCRQRLLSCGATFDLPVGSTRTLQGNGDGEFNLFLSGMTEIMDGWHLISTPGLRLPADSGAESQVAYWSNHLDREIFNGIYVLGEVNWYHWMRSGRSFPLPVEGLDLINLGSIGVAGKDIVTAAVGLKYKPCRNTELGVAIEFPVTDDRDIIDNRLTVDWIIRY